ncbi:hypothetical protein [Paenibacillus sp. NPDC058071]|uniref:hypothetical protein n=1 Tax=Paenibacillus sp. NPDC058071 TaxID=3346326 RepID=UPI0036D81183
MKKGWIAVYALGIAAGASVWIYSANTYTENVVKTFETVLFDPSGEDPAIREVEVKVNGEVRHTLFRKPLFVGTVEPSGEGVAGNDRLLRMELYKSGDNWMSHMLHYASIQFAEPDYKGTPVFWSPDYQLLFFSRHFEQIALGVQLPDSAGGGRTIAGPASDRDGAVQASRSLMEAYYGPFKQEGFKVKDMIK